MKRNKVFALLMVVVVMTVSTGCYLWKGVGTEEVGAKVVRNEIVETVGPGVYTNMVPFRQLYTYSIATLTFEVEDPEVATSDNQLVGVKITIQARRKGDDASNRSFHTNWSNLLDDGMLISTIDANAREAIKNGTRGFTLMQLLDDRNGLASGISKQLSEDVGKYNVDIINVTIENVSIAPEYAQVLQDTAKLIADEKYQKQREGLIKQQADTDLFEKAQEQLVLAEQLKVETAQTLVDVEIAGREGAKTQAAQEVYLTNDRAFNLKQLELMGNIFGTGTMWMVDPSTNLTLLLSQMAGTDDTTPFVIPGGN